MLSPAFSPGLGAGAAVGIVLAFLGGYHPRGGIEHDAQLLAIATAELDDGPRHGAEVAKRTNELGVRLVLGANRWSISRRVPAGVVSVIAPFNYPLTLGIRRAR